MTTDQPGPVLVTGATGFIAGHVVRELLEHGYRVRGTVRDPAATERTAHLRALAQELGGELEFTAADLTRDDGWAEAVAGCSAVMHVASPFPIRTPREESELVRPAVDGTLRLLRAAAATDTVERVVMTSSIAAIVTGEDRGDRVHTEADWSDPAVCAAYAKSKTLAERAAWDFMAEHSPGFDLVAMNPGFVMGPLLNADTNSSAEVIKLLLNRATPGSPHMGFATVDVRDVATAHRLGLEKPDAAGNRYILAGEHTWTVEIAKTLAEEFNPRGYRVPTLAIPTWLVWLAARFDATARAILVFIGKRDLVTSDKARAELGWSMRPLRDSVIDTAESMIGLGVVKPRRGLASTVPPPDESGHP